MMEIDDQSGSSLLIMAKHKNPLKKDFLIRMYKVSILNVRNFCGNNEVAGKQDGFPELHIPGEKKKQ